MDIKELVCKSARGNLRFRTMSLLYSVFVLIDPIERHSAFHWWLLLVVYLVFLGLFLSIPVTKGWKRTAIIAALFVLCFAYFPFNNSASGLFVYPAATLPFLVRRKRPILIMLLFYLPAIALEAHLFQIAWWSAGIGVFFTATITLTNMYWAEQQDSDARLQMARDEIENLAKVAERERIARDLHDVLGHTLTLVVLKAQLAEKLVESQPGAARRELEEIHQAARKALAEVREAVQGYRSQGLPDEMMRARHTLETAVIAATIEGDAAEASAELGAEQEAVMVLALREAITNVVRHSEAKSCVVSLKSESGRIVLSVKDDGKGIHDSGMTGFGLRGMRERVESVGGEMQLLGESGTVLRVILTAASPKEMVQEKKDTPPTFAPLRTRQQAMWEVGS